MIAGMSEADVYSTVFETVNLSIFRPITHFVSGLYQTAHLTCILSPPIMQACSQGGGRGLGGSIDPPFFTRALTILS